jgi:hypothetical protein
MAGQYDARDHYIAFGMGNLSKDQYHCKKAAVVGARAELAKELQVLVMSYSMDGLQETPSGTEQEIMVLRQEYSQAFLQDVRIVQYKEDATRGTCSVVIVMPRKSVPTRRPSALQPVALEPQPSQLGP